MSPSDPDHPVPSGPGEEGRYAYSGIDRLLHEKARLGILTCLMSNPGGLLFGELKTYCALTDGNLSRHLQALHDADLVAVWKGFEKRRPQTLCRLTNGGRTRFLEYLSVLEGVLDDAQAQQGESSEDRELPPGWIPI